jgi:hypothetical protein
VATVEFTFLGVPRRYPDLVQHHAVLAASVAQKCPGKEAIINQVRHLVARWRERVSELADVGWPGLGGGGTTARRARSLALNCRPAFARTAEETRPCRDRAVCPFCHARRVRATWERIDRAFFGDRTRASSSSAGVTTSRPRRDRSDFELLERRVIFELPCGPDDEVSLAHWIGSVVENRTERIRGWKGLPGMKGGYETLHVRKSPQGRWLVEFRMIFLVSALFEVPGRWSEVQRLDGGISVHSLCRRRSRPDRRMVMLAVALACQYSKFLLEGTPSDVAKFLRARRAGQPGGFKVTCSFGMLGKKTARK